MSPLTQFIAFFLAVSAVTALVSTLIQEERPWRSAGQAVQFFAYIVVGIAGLSAVVRLLEHLFLRNS